MRIVLADDAVILRDGLARLLGEAGFEVAGLPADAEELLALVEQLHPDVAIVDIRMPQRTPMRVSEPRKQFGNGGLKRASSSSPSTGQHVRASYVLELLSDGTDRIGYLLKDRVSDLAELASSVEQIRHGGTAPDPEVPTRPSPRQSRADPIGRTGLANRLYERGPAVKSPHVDVRALTP
ncbi:MAG TPA: response regulator [Solirubrobacteraceae bacterium]